MFMLTRPVVQARGGLTTLERRLDRLFGEAFQDWPGFTQEDSGSLMGTWIPRVDVYEEKDPVKCLLLRLRPNLPHSRPPKEVPEGRPAPYDHHELARWLRPDAVHDHEEHVRKGGR